jgi:hypothetical protein
VVPLSVDLEIFTEAPTATKVLFPKTTPHNLLPVREVALSQVSPLSVDLRIIPSSPTTTNTPETEEEESSEEESSEEETVKEVIVRESLKFVTDLLVVTVIETLIVQSAYVPTLKVFKVMVLLPEIAEVVLEEHEPP